MHCASCVVARRAGAGLGRASPARASTSPPSAPRCASAGPVAVERLSRGGRAPPATSARDRIGQRGIGGRGARARVARRCAGGSAVSASLGALVVVLAQFGEWPPLNAIPRSAAEPDPAGARDCRSSAGRAGRSCAARGARRGAGHRRHEPAGRRRHAGGATGTRRVATLAPGVLPRAPAGAPHVYFDTAVGDRDADPARTPARGARRARHLARHAPPARAAAAQAPSRVGAASARGGAARCRCSPATLLLVRPGERVPVDGTVRRRPLERRPLAADRRVAAGRGRAGRSR